jgi:hypothetical protein
MIHQIAKKDGSEKSWRKEEKGCRVYWPWAENFRPHVKGMSIPMHDFRALGAMPSICSWKRRPSHEGDLPEGKSVESLDRFSVEKKGSGDGWQKTRCIFNNIGVCNFGVLGVPLRSL